MSTNGENPARRPWYRQFWPWFLVTPPAVAVLAGVATVILAVRSPNPLVVDDYTTIARMTHRNMARDSEAMKLGLSAMLRFDIHRNQLRVSLDGAAPESLTLRFVHPTRAELDTSVILHFDGERYSSALPALAPGRWYVQLEPDQGGWRLSGEMRQSVETLLLRAAEDAT